MNAFACGGINVLYAQAENRHLAPTVLAVLVLAPVSVVVKDRYGFDLVEQVFWNYTNIWIENDLNSVLFPIHF